MKKNMFSLLFFLFFFSFSSKLHAQKTGPVTADTLLKIAKADTTHIVLPVNTLKNNLKEQLGASSLNGTTSQLKQAGTLASQKVDGLKKSISSLKKSPLSLNLSLENAFMYHPLASPFSLNSGRKFANVFSVRGGLNAWGIPININYSTDQASSMSSQGAVNNLYKFDFDPRQLKGMLTSNLSRYYDVRRNLFNGLDLTGYTHQAIMDQLVKKNTMQVLPQNTALAKCLSNPLLVNQLLTMNREQINEKLTAELNSNKANLINGHGNIGVKGYTLPNAKVDEVKNQIGEARGLLADKSLTGYFEDPGHIVELQNMNEDQIAAKITSYGQHASVYQPLPDDLNKVMPVSKFDINGLMRGLTNSHNASLDTLTKQTAHEVFLSVRQNNSTNFTSIITAKEKSANQHLQSAALPDSTTKAGLVGNVTTPAQIDSVAGIITGISSQLQKNGFDVNHMLQMQDMLNQHDNNYPLSEMGSSFVSNSPANAMQSLFSNVEALKLGSFGNQVPGNVQSRDIFMDGAHLTYNAQGIPITFGYGTVNDVSSFKDAVYQGSVYNQPRNMTYFAAEIKKARGGSLKISVISSFSREIANSLYTIPTISSNNVAFTLSKGLNLGNLGNLGLDVSKTTTLYDNKFQPGGEAILDKKAGLSTNLTNDLFSAMSFGVRHSLNITQLDASDNVYFNYAGMGYQNPANNGFGGAMMKLGGNIKKSFYNRKLTFSLRTDLSNMPISYTTNDEWKTHQVQLDTRYQINKKVTIGLNYTNSGTDKKIDNAISPVYGLQKVQLNGNASYKVGKYYSVSHFTVGTQSFSNMNAMQGGGNLLMVNYTQSLIMHNNTLTASVFYNKELSSYQLVGNMLNSDVSYQYTLFRKVSMSSGLTYLDNTSFARQAGIRQTVQLFASGSFDVDSYVDVRRNLVKSVFPDLYPLCRAELSLKYHFKI